MKPSVVNSHATIFSAKKVDDKVSYQHSYINDERAGISFKTLLCSKNPHKMNVASSGKKGTPIPPSIDRIKIAI